MIIGAGTVTVNGNSIGTSNLNKISIIRIVKKSIRKNFDLILAVIIK
jgi:hypothetical protein